MSGERGDARKRLMDLARLSAEADAQSAALRPAAPRPKDRFTIHVPQTTAALSIKHPDGRDLFVFHRDGTVTGDVGDASEAAAIFVREVKRLMGTDRLATDTAAPEEPVTPGHPVDCGCDRCCFGTTPAAPVAVEGVETVEWTVETRTERGFYDERFGTIHGQHLAPGPILRGERPAQWFTRERATYRHPDRVSEWSPVEPETSEPEGGES